jgi:hypothetical protein
MNKFNDENVRFILLRVTRLIFNLIKSCIEYIIYISLFMKVM